MARLKQRKTHGKWWVARVPKPVASRVRRSLRTLVHVVAWSTSMPEKDAPLILSRFAHVSSLFAEGTRLEIIEMIRERAAALRLSNEHDDLVAAAELEDLAVELESQKLPPDPD